MDTIKKKTTYILFKLFVFLNPIYYKKNKKMYIYITYVSFIHDGTF